MAREYSYILGTDQSNVTAVDIGCNDTHLGRLKMSPYTMCRQFRSNSVYALYTPGQEKAIFSVLQV